MSSSQPTLVSRGEDVISSLASLIAGVNSIFVSVCCGLLSVRLGFALFSSFSWFVCLCSGFVCFGLSLAVGNSTAAQRCLRFSDVLGGCDSGVFVRGGVCQVLFTFVSECAACKLLLCCV